MSAQSEPKVDYGLYQAHPAADEFPLIMGTDFDRFVADIEAHGQHQPVVLCPDGKRIADGRNRFRACQRLEVEPLFATLGPEYDTDEKIADYIESANLQRLHLDATQRAMIAARLANRYAEEGKERRKRGPRKGRSEGTSPDAAPAPPRRLVRTPRDRSDDAAERAAEEMKVSPRYVRRAQRLQAEAPDLAEKVEAGKVKLTAADKQLQRRRGPAKSKPTPSTPRATEVEDDERPMSDDAKEELSRLAQTMPGVTIGGLPTGMATTPAPAARAEAPEEEHQPTAKLKPERPAQVANEFWKAMRTVAEDFERQFRSLPPTVEVSTFVTEGLDGTLDTMTKLRQRIVGVR